MKKISIVIVNFRTWDSLNLCLESILEQKKLDCEVIVVDNNSDDNKLYDFKIKYSWVKWVKNQKNYGFAKACNIGASFSSSNWVLFLNPDTILVKNSLNTLLIYCEKNTDHKIIGIKQLNDNLKHVDPSGLFLNFWSLTGFSRAIIRQFKFSNNEAANFPDWISGSFVLIRKKDFDSLNGWDEDFWMYYEDMDLCKRAKNIGMKIILLNKWNYKHSHGKASRKDNATKIVAKSQVIISSHIYIEKHSKKSIKFINHLLLIFLRSSELILKSIFSRTYREIFKKSYRFWLVGISKNIWKSEMINN